jgi:hypothetical protein
MHLPFKRNFMAGPRPLNQVFYRNGSLIGNENHEYHTQEEFPELLPGFLINLPG